MFYLAVGAALGPWGAGLVHVNAIEDASIVERLTEMPSSFRCSAGLKLRLPGSDQRWRAPILLAALALVLTIGGIAAFAVTALGLPISAAVLLGAVPVSEALHQGFTGVCDAVLTNPDWHFRGRTSTRMVQYVTTVGWSTNEQVNAPVRMEILAKDRQTVEGIPSDDRLLSERAGRLQRQSHRVGE
jgi:hypothetical protein